MKERQYNVKSWSKNDTVRLKEIVREGLKINQEITDLKEGLSETVKAIAEELSIKPAQINRAIKIAAKGTMGEERDKLDEIEDILIAAGQYSDSDDDGV